VTERRGASEVPVFSQRLDELMAAMIKGEAPNVGRFCAYCYTPIGPRATACPHCGRALSDVGTLEKLPPELFALYRRMRRRESIIVNSFAFAGLGVGLLLFIGLVALAVYRYDQSLWLLGASVVVFMVGGRIFAGLLGGWIGDAIGYDYAQRKLVEEWREYERQRQAGDGRRITTDAAGEPAR
jgi:hypothetical protein